MATFIPGRDFQATLSDVQMINIAKTWHKTCKTEHISCTLDGHDVPLPDRVIHVGCSEDSKITPRLYVPVEGTVGEYMALSYCWGKSAQICLTQESIHRFLTDGIPLDQTPKTIQDAFTLCRALGFRFLWVDCLCIVQDSKEDWERQASIMGAIYSKATITIRAAVGAESDHGLFTPRVKEKNVSVRLPCVAPNSLVGECFVRGELYCSTGDPLDGRGWALQESLLAPRTVTFGHVEMFWECRHACWNESGNSTTILVPAATVLPRPLRERQQYTYVDITGNEQVTGNELALPIWKQIVKYYSHRTLTLENDKLAAIAGLARHYSQVSKEGKDVYLAGVWKSQLPESLLWYHQLPSDTNASKPEQYRAPSWSWASLDCKYLEWFQDSECETSFAKLLSVETTLKGPDCFGQVSAGSIEVQAPFRRGWLLANVWHPESYDIWDDNWQEDYQNPSLGTIDSRLGRVHFDIERSARCGDRPESAYCLRITKNGSLLVTPCSETGRDGLWTRLGVVEFNDKGVKWWQDCEEDILTIL